MHIKPRIVIRAHTSRRDVAPAALLATILERMGCETFIACVRNIHWVLRWWKPDAVVTFTPSSSGRIRALAPDSKIVFLDGEGHQTKDSIHALKWLKAPELYESIDLVLAWGNVFLKDMEEVAPQLDRSKIRVVGNPKLDLVRFLPNHIKQVPTKSVGVVCRFGTLNHENGVSPLRSLGDRVDLDNVIATAKAYYTLYHTIDAILHETDYRVSIRPHPMENIDTYHRFLKHQLGLKRQLPSHGARIDIDESLMIPEWIAQQSVLLSPTSTTFLEAYVLGKPMINIDRIANTVEFNRGVAEICAEWQSGAIMPESIDEVIETLKQPIPTVGQDPDIENQLQTHCNWQSGQSACYAAAREIMALLEVDKSRRSIAVPRPIVDFRDNLSFRRAVWRNPMHTNFNYREGFHPLPDYLGEMADDIIRREAAR